MLEILTQLQRCYCIQQGRHSNNANWLDEKKTWKKCYTNCKCHNPNTHKFVFLKSLAVTVRHTAQVFYLHILSDVNCWRNLYNFWARPCVVELERLTWHARGPGIDSWYQWNRIFYLIPLPQVFPQGNFIHSTRRQS